MDFMHNRKMAHMDVKVCCVRGSICGITQYGAQVQ